MKTGKIFFTHNLNERFKTFHRLASGDTKDRPKFPIKGFRIVDGGKDYSLNAKIDILDPVGSGATCSVIVNKDGIITDVKLLTPGKDYVSPICKITDETGSEADIIPLLDGNNGLFRFNTTSERFEGMVDYEWINFLSNEDIRPKDWEWDGSGNVTKEILSEIMKRLTFTATGSFSFGMNSRPTGTIIRDGIPYGNPIVYPNDWSTTNPKYRVQYVSSLSNNLEMGMVDDLTNACSCIVKNVNIQRNTSVVFSTDFIIDFAYFIGTQNYEEKRGTYRYDAYVCLGEIIDSTPGSLRSSPLPFYYDVDIVPLSTDIDSPDYGKYKVLIKACSHGNSATGQQQQDFQITAQWFVSVVKFRDFNIL